MDGVLESDIFGTECTAVLFDREIPADSRDRILRSELLDRQQVEKDIGYTYQLRRLGL